MAFDPSKFTVPAAKPLPVILLLDVSGSMQRNDNIGALNKAVTDMIASFSDQTKREVEIQVAAITFGAEVKLHLPYTSAREISWMPLTANGMTPLSTALEMAKAMVEDKSVTPSRAYRPAVVLVSDGAPVPAEQPWREALKAFVSEGRSAKCERMALGIGSEADESVLQAFVDGTDNAKVFHAEDAAGIADFFKFVTMSVTTRSKSINPNQAVVQTAISATTAAAVTPSNPSMPQATTAKPDEYW
jgi:uncharacterized protein YegL